MTCNEFGRDLNTYFGLHVVIFSIDYKHHQTHPTHVLGVFGCVWGFLEHLKEHIATNRFKISVPIWW